MPETPRGIAFLRTGLGGELSNAMSGSRAGCEVTLFDYQYETGITPRTERTHAQTVAAFRSPHLILPAFEFGPEPVMRKMLTILGVGWSTQRPQRGLARGRRFHSSMLA
jgi:hypothetical protein